MANGTRKHVEIYSVSDSRGVPGYAASVHYRTRRGEEVEQFYFKGRCPSESEVLRAFENRMEGND